jgi:hypothetical protein
MPLVFLVFFVIDLSRGSPRSYIVFGFVLIYHVVFLGARQINCSGLEVVRIAEFGYRTFNSLR